jgi:hypothetical protein
MLQLNVHQWSSLFQNCTSLPFSDSFTWSVTHQSLMLLHEHYRVWKGRRTFSVANWSSFNVVNTNSIPQFLNVSVILSIRSSFRFKFGRSFLHDETSITCFTDTYILIILLWKKGAETSVLRLYKDSVLGWGAVLNSNTAFWGNTYSLWKYISWTYLKKNVCPFVFLSGCSN